MKIVINCYADTLLAFAHAECAAKLNLITEIVFTDKILKLFYNLTGAFDMAGTTNSYCNFHCIYLLIPFYS